MYFMLMSVLAWPHCIGQTRIKEVLEAAILNRALGHAYLFSGAEGCGKFAAASGGIARRKEAKAVHKEPTEKGSQEMTGQHAGIAGPL